MKKTTFTTLAILILAAVAFAQPTTDNSLPGIGSTYFFNQVTGNIVHPAGGADQVWNFQPLTNSALLYYEVISQSSLSSTDISTFPTSNYYTQSYYGSIPLNINFYEIQAAQKLWLGQSLSGGGYDINNPAQVDYEFGMNFGSVITYPVNNGNITRTTTYDAYGSLTTPFGTQSNVIRLKTSETGSGATTDTLYIYYATLPVMRPLLQYVVTATGQTSNKFVYNYSNLVTSTSDLESNSVNLNIYPNPACDVLYLTGNNNVKNVEIYNSLMQETENNTIGSDNSISVSELKPGLYFIKTGNSLLKFIKK